MVEMVSVEQMSSAASYVARNWGEHGYRLGVELAGYGQAAFLARASDGSEFRFLTDRFGNCSDLPAADDLEGALELRREAIAAADSSDEQEEQKGARR